MAKMGMWRLVGVITLGAVAVGACSSDDDDDNGPNGGTSNAGKGGGSQAGSAGTAGRGGQTHTAAGAGGSAGEGADGPGGEAGGPQRETCGPYPLSEICEKGPTDCSSSPEDVIESQRVAGACQLFEFFRSASTCGGTIVVSNGGFGEDTWSFDEDDVLIGLTSSSDQDFTCKDGGRSFQVTYGQLCEPVGTQEELCVGSGGAGGAGGAAGAGGAGGAGGASEP